MIAALIDNGSLEPAVHRNLRAVAAALSDSAGVRVDAVSWNHSDRIDPKSLGGNAAETIERWLRARTACGEREFAVVPFFISADGAIGSRLRHDLRRLRNEIPGGFHFEITPSLSAQRVLARITAGRIRETIARERLRRPPVIVVDHGGPSAASARLRNAVAENVRADLADEAAGTAAASLEGDAFAHNRPLFSDVLQFPGFDRGDVVVAPLFLAPGRHAGANGDLAQVADGASDRPVTPPLRVHFTGLVGTHPLAIEALTEGLTRTISLIHAAA